MNVCATILTNSDFRRAWILGLILVLSTYVFADGTSVAYTSATTKEPSNGHFVVQITSTSSVTVLCQIEYAGRSFLGADRSGVRTIALPSVGKSGAPVLSKAEFGGFHTFSAAVTCKAK